MPQVLGQDYICSITGRPMIEFYDLVIIYHFMYFKKNQTEVQALLDFSNKINTMTLAYIAKVGLKVLSINVRIQKIDNSTLKLLEILLASFLVVDKLRI